jgi:hypothetical protein
LAVGEQTWAYARVHEGQSAVIAISNGSSFASFDAPAGPAGLVEGAVLVDLLGGPDVRVVDGRLPFALSARTAALYVAKTTR